MKKFALNFRKAGNYAFFCPQSRLHLTRSNPIGFADEVTSYIQRGLKSGVIIDVTEDTNIPGPTVNKQAEQARVADTKSTEQVKTDTSLEVHEEKETSPRRGRRGSQN